MSVGIWKRKLVVVKVELVEEAACWWAGCAHSRALSLDSFPPNFFLSFSSAPLPPVLMPLTYLSVEQSVITACRPEAPSELGSA